MEEENHFREITIHFILEQIPKSLVLFLLSLILGYFLSGIIEIFSTELNGNLKDLFFLFIQLKAFSLPQPLGLFLNNWMAVVLSLILSMLFIYKRQNKQSKYTLLIFLYFIPIGAAVINGLVLGSLAFSIEGWMNKLMAFMPYGAFEAIAIILSSSLGLSFTRALKPYIGKKEFKSHLRNILKSKSVIFYLIVISILILFSALMESKVISLAKEGVHFLNF